MTGYGSQTEVFGADPRQTIVFQILGCLVALLVPAGFVISVCQEASMLSFGHPHHVVFGTAFLIGCLLGTLLFAAGWRNRKVALTLYEFGVTYRSRRKEWACTYADILVVRIGGKDHSLHLTLRSGAVLVGAMIADLDAAGQLIANRLTPDPPLLDLPKFPGR